MQNMKTLSSEVIWKHMFHQAKIKIFLKFTLDIESIRILSYPRNEINRQLTLKIDKRCFFV